MDFQTAPAVKQALIDRFSQGILGYSKIDIDPYKNVFKDWCKRRYDFEVKNDWLVLSAGVIPALFDLVGYLCQPDEKILFFTPSYAFFMHAANHNNINYETSPLLLDDGAFKIDWQDLEDKLKDEKVTCTVLCSPHNPTGKIWSNEELSKFASLCFKYNVTIISDEIHCDLLRSGNSFTPLQKLYPDSDQIVTCMAPSKTFNLAGIMQAHILIPNESLREQWNKDHLPIANPLSIVAAQAAYEHGDHWLEQLKTYIDTNFEYVRQFLAEKLPKAQFSISDATYLAWINLGAYFPKDQNLTIFFANEAGVLLEGGNMFVDNAEGYIRLNLACPLSKVKMGLHRIEETMKAHGFA